MIDKIKDLSNLDFKTGYSLFELYNLYMMDLNFGELHVFSLQRVFKIEIFIFFKTE